MKSYDEGVAGRRYAHSLVVGLDRPPRKVTKKSSAAKQEKRSKVRRGEERRGGRREQEGRARGRPRPPTPSPPPRPAQLRTFVKVVNHQHIMPTRYNLDVDVKAAVPADAADNSTKRADARKAAKELLEAKFKTGTNRWFYSKLRF